MKVGGINKVIPYFLGVLLLACIALVLFVALWFPTSYIVEKTKKSRFNDQIVVGGEYFYYDYNISDVYDKPLEKNPFDSGPDTVVISRISDGYVEYYRIVNSCEHNSWYDENYDYPHKYMRSENISKFKRFTKRLK